MNAQRAPVALEQNVKVAAGLRVLHHAETGAMSGNGEVLAIIAGDLQKDAAIRAAFIGLAGRMQKSRSEFEAGCDVAPVAQRQPQLLQDGDVLLAARQI